MRIAICDDDKKQVEQVAEILRPYGKAGHQFELYYDSQELAEDIVRGELFDLVILDIEMPGFDGLELARKMRELDQPPYIFFITSYMGYINQTFHVEAVQCLIKPIEPKTLIEEFEYVLERYRQNKRQIALKRGSESVFILLKSIVYIEAYKRQLRIVTKHREESFPGDFRLKVFKELPDNFFRVHQGYIVNLDCVQQFVGTQIELNNGAKIPVGCHKVSEVKRYMNKYLAQKR